MFASALIVSRIAAKVCVVVIGMAALYCACFLYEDEMGKLQNRIMQWWIDIDDRRKHGQNLVFISKSAGFVNRQLDRFLGKRLISFQLIAISVSCSLICATILFSIGSFEHRTALAHLLTISVILGAVISIVLIPRYSNIWFSLGSIATLSGMFIAWINTSLYESIDRSAEHILGTLTISVASDALFIALVRYSLRMLLKKPGFTMFALMMVIQCAVFSVVLVLPGFLISLMIMSPSINFPRLDWDLLYVVEFNVSTGLLCLSFVAFVLFMAVHRLIQKTLWPVLARFFYPVVQFELIRNRKVMIGFACVCIAILFPDMADRIKKAAEWFH